MSFESVAEGRTVIVVAADLMPHNDKVPPLPLSLSLESLLSKNELVVIDMDVRVLSSIGVFTLLPHPGLFLPPPEMLLRPSQPKKFCCDWRRRTSMDDDVGLLTVKVKIAHGRLLFFKSCGMHGDVASIDT